MTQITTTISSANIGDETKDVRIVKFEGQLDETNVDTEAQKIYQIFNESADKKMILIFDLSNLTYLNSKSIGYITDWYNKAIETGGKIFIASAHDNVMDVLRVVGLTNIIEFHLTIEEAKLSAMNV